MHVNRIVTRLAAAVLMVSTLITPTFAANGIVNTEGPALRLRAEASTEGSILEKLANGTQVEVLSVLEEGWYQVSYRGLTGYVSAEYLTVEEEADELEELQEEPVAEADAPLAAAAQSAAAESDGKSYVRVVEGPLNIRTAPTTDSSKAGKLYTGRVVEVLEQLDGWYRIENGYISAEYVVTADASEAQASGQGQGIAEYALQYLGCRYVYGGSSPKGFDCSGFTSYVYKQFGISIQRTASGQLNNGYAVSRGELKPGDLVMFKSYGSKPASHVGIYIGGGEFVHASAPGVGVVIDSLNSSFYSRTYVGARRIL